MSLYLFFIFVHFLVLSSEAVGPLIQATKGEVWPKPQQEQKSQDYYIISPSQFQFKVSENISCPEFLNQALLRYLDIISNRDFGISENRLIVDDSNLGNLNLLEIEIEEDCLNDNIYPTLEDNENYNITVDSNRASLSAVSIWGVLRGLETFSQLIYESDDQLLINATVIIDYPRFPHRGLLIDTSRHFQPVSVILQMLDAMAFNKFNVFHWHITDDQSFPYKSLTFPELSDLGAYHPTLTVYQQTDVAQIIEYARLRGIRVIPEFDTPGHTSSWGVAHPELLTQCYNSQEPTGELGPMDPSKNSTFEFLLDLFSEIVQVFPDSYFHIGGDEVDFSCWESNPRINAFMNYFNITTFKQLESYFIQNVIEFLDHLNTKYLVWEEVFDNGVELPDSTIVHVWKNNGFSTLSKVVEAGKKGLFSSCWYLSVLHSGGDWNTFYNCEPFLLIHEQEQQNLVLGGEACMWGEYVNEFSIIPRVWPRASAVAERLWSSQDVTDIVDAAARLEEHTCRMNKRGIAAQPPNGPGVCL